MPFMKTIAPVAAGGLAIFLALPLASQAAPSSFLPENTSSQDVTSSQESRDSRTPLAISLSPKSSVAETQKFWQKTANMNKPWQGGDATYTIPLADGRVLWLWGDSFRGDRRPNGSLAEGWGMVRNSVAVGLPNASTWAFAHNMSKEFFPNTKKDKVWYWPLYGASGGLTVRNKERGQWVWIFAHEVTYDISRNASGFNFMGSGNAIYRVWVPQRGLPKMWSKRMVPFPEAGTEIGILWGAGLEKVGNTVYIYGTRRVHEPLTFGRELFLARTSFGSVGDTRKWEFWNGSRWSSRVNDAAVIHPGVGGVSTTLSADYINGVWTLVTKKDEFLGTDVVALTSPNPWGPFTEKVLFTSPSTEKLYTYQASAHPELTSPPGTMVVTINRNPADFAEAIRKPQLYRPLFRVVNIPR